MSPEELIFNVRTNTGNSVSELKNINKATADTGESVKKMGSDYQSQLDAIKKKVDSGALSQREMTKAVREYQTVALQAGESSPVGMQAIAEAGQLKDRLGDLQAQVNVLGHDGANMQAALQLGSTVTAGYGALQGITAMLGGDTDALTESFVKLQAVQTTLASLEQIRAATEKESFLMVKAQVLWTNLQTAASNKLTIAQIAQNGATAVTTAVTGAAATAMGVLNAVMLLNPVFLLIAAFAALAVGLALFGGSAETAAEDQEKLNKSIERQNELLQLSNENRIRSANNRLKLAQAEGASEQTLLQKRLDVLKEEETARNKNLRALESQYRQQGALRKTANREANGDVKKAAEDEMLAIESKYRKLKSLDGQYYADRKAELIKFNREQREIQMKDDAAEIQGKILQARGNFSQQQQLRKDQASLERKQALSDTNLTESQKFLIQQQYEQKVSDLNTESAERGKKARDERNARDKENAQNRLELDKLITDLSVANIEDEWQRKFTALDIAHERERSELIKKYGKDTKLLIELKKKQDGELFALDEERFKIEQAKLDEQAKIDQEKAAADRRAQLESELIEVMSDFEKRNKLQRELAALELEESTKNKQLSTEQNAKLEQEYYQKIKLLDDEVTEHQKANDKSLADSKKALRESVIKGAQDANNLTMGLSDAIFGYQLNNVEKGSAQELSIKKKQFEINKKLQIVNAAIQGTQAVLAAFASGSAIPLVGAVAGPAFAALAAVTVAANIAKIKSSTFEGGAPLVSAPSVSMPSNIISNGTTSTAGIQDPQTPSGNTSGSPVILVVDSYKKVAEQSAKAQQVATVG